MNISRHLSAKIASLAIPAIVTNITTPILSLSDMAIVGHIGGAVFIAAIAVGGMSFNMLYWLCGFLRMGSSGLTAQCYGAHDIKGCHMVLARAMFVALGLGGLMVLLRAPIFDAVIKFMDCDADTLPAVRIYFNICIWGAPAVLGTFSLTGWWLGMQNSRIPMWVSIFTDLFNILLSVTFVFGFRMGLYGVATGTLIAQWAAFLLGLALCRRYRVKIPDWRDVLRWHEVGKFFRINADIFLRTVCLVGVSLWFTRVGAMQGTVMLAVNALLMQLFTVFSFFMDGFAFSAEALCGRFKGAANRQMLKHTIHVLLGVSTVFAVVFTILYAVSGQEMLRLISSDTTVVAKASEYYWWAASIPLLGFAAFIWDGVSIGVTATRRMLKSMVCATVVFFIVYVVAYPSLGNHGLWMAFVGYLFVRGVALWVLNRRYWCCGEY